MNIMLKTFLVLSILRVSSSFYERVFEMASSKFEKTNISVRFEHIAINVPNPEAMAKWYTSNLGMKIVRGGFAPNASAFIADSGMHLMLEILHNINYPVFESAKIHSTSIHLAFVTSNIIKTQEQLVGAGATVADSLRKTASGDQVMTLRDPWGLPGKYQNGSKKI
jgi:glyoxylase I family protein